jgi:hypothetical protein
VYYIYIKIVMSRIALVLSFLFLFRTCGGGGGSGGHSSSGHTGPLKHTAAEGTNNNNEEDDNEQRLTWLSSHHFHNMNNHHPHHFHHHHQEDHNHHLQKQTSSSSSHIIHQQQHNNDNGDGLLDAGGGGGLAEYLDKHNKRFAKSEKMNSGKFDGEHGIRHGAKILDRFEMEAERGRVDPEGLGKVDLNVSTISELIMNLRGLRGRDRRSQSIILMEQPEAGILGDGAIGGSGFHPNGTAKGYFNNSNNNSLLPANLTWPLKRVAKIEGDIWLGGLMMVHERQDEVICGPIMPQVQGIPTFYHDRKQKRLVSSNLPIDYTHTAKWHSLQWHSNPKNLYKSLKINLKQTVFILAHALSQYRDRYVVNVNFELISNPIKYTTTQNLG